MRRRLLVHFFLLCPVTVAWAQSAEESSPLVEIDREKRDSRPPRTLRFLRENQGFLRAQLDQLRTKITWTHGDARNLSEHELWLQGLGTEQLAAFDSLNAERQTLARRTLLQRIEELGEVEEQLDRIEALLAAQELRLDGIESDYVRRQETALALLATGLPDALTEAIHVQTLDGDAHRVALDDAMRQALRTGAVAQLFHDFVEPRTTTLVLSFELRDGTLHPLGTVEIEPARDRLTFVQVDLSTATDAVGALALAVWER